MGDGGAPVLAAVEAVVGSVYEHPGRPAVLGSVDAGSELGHISVIRIFLLVGRRAGHPLWLEAVLDDGHQDFRLAAGNGQADSTAVTRGKPGGQLDPGPAAVRGLEDAAIRSARIKAPGLAQALPEADI